MATNPQIEAPRIYPTLRCRDAEAMIRWLIDVIGFTEEYDAFIETMRRRFSWRPSRTGRPPFASRR